MTHWVLLSLLSLSLLGATYAMETDGKYRVFIGPDHRTDWVDVCCRYTDQLQLEFADYTPIERLVIERKGGVTRYEITKKYSRWVLMGRVEDPLSWSLRQEVP